MSTINKVLLFLIKFPFRLLAIPVAIILYGGCIAINLINKLGGLVIGLFNILFAIALIGAAMNKQWDLILRGMFIFLAEGVVLFSGGAVQAVVVMLRSSIMSFITGVHHEPVIG